MRMRRHLLCIALCLAATAAASAGPHVGVFALQGGTAKTSGHLVAERVGAEPLRLRFDVWLTSRGSSKPIRAYDLDMTKLLHLIVVSDDFRTFSHLHPALRSDGHFALDAQLPRAGRYLVYADAIPHGIGQQVFRFDVSAGNATRSGARDLSERGGTAKVGPYVLALSGGPLRAGSEGRLAVRVTKGGKPAADLHPYLGAPAHAVFLNARDLTYGHVHPTAGTAGMTAMATGGSTHAMPTTARRDSAAASPSMQLHVDLREPGTYKLWLQFRGGAQVYVAPFVIVAR